MAENLLIHTGTKEEKYRELLPQLQALVSSETNLIANLASISTVSRAYRLHTHSFRQRSLRYGMEGGADTDCS